MVLAPGARIGVYEVTSLLGTGGMGEVYRARDTVLNREAAVKVLPEPVASDPDRLARFRREAELLAGLNHPNIAQVYGVESTPSGPALVMELVGGPTLEDTIKGGPVPWQDALVIAHQIAAALDAAHERGIIHRDLKPANVKTTEDGVVKVLDFGLAKAVGPDSASGSEVANSPTLTARATVMGVILGTAAYMAPEQAKGRAVDKRADIWAFGAVLYELLTGRRALDGDDVSDVLAAVIKTEPAWTALPADVPDPVRRLVRRCLEKDPRRRLRDIAEGMLQLDEGLAQPAPASASSRAWWRTVGLVAAGVTLTAAALSPYALRDPAPRPPAAAQRFSMAPADLSISINPRPHIGVAPDGTIIYSGRSGLIAKRQADFDGVRLEGAENGTTPFISPDGQWLGFVNARGTLDTELVKVPIGGGPRTPIAKSLHRIYGADWGPDDTIVFGTRAGLFRVAPRSETPVPLTTGGTRSRDSHVWPAFAGSTGLVLFTIGQFASARLAAVTVATGVITDLGVSGSFPRYLPTGHIVYVTADGVLRAVPFDAQRIAVTGTSVPLESGVRIRADFGAADFDVSDSGTLVYVSAPDVVSVPIWIDRNGKETATAVEPNGYSFPRLSRAADRLLLVARARGSADALMWDFSRSGLRPLPRTTGSAGEGLWVGDDRAVLLSVVRNSEWTISRLNADGSGQEVVLFASDRRLTPHAFTPDGSVIVRHDDDIALLRVDGQPRVETLVAEASNPALSPDGRWLAYESTKSESREVYVRPFPKVDGGEWLISRGSGAAPAWSREGDELFFIRRGEMMSVSVGPGFPSAAGTPRVLFQTEDYSAVGLGRHFDVGPSGRFVMLKRLEQPRPVMRIVLNFFDEVAARVRAK